MERRRMKASVSLNAGESAEVTTPLGKVLVRAAVVGHRSGTNAQAGTDVPADVFDVSPDPTDVKLHGRVLLCNVQDRSHTVRLVALERSVEGFPEQAVPELVEEERRALVDRVLKAMAAAYPGGFHLAAGDSVRPDAAAKIAAKVEW